jgi:CMP/dCMP kinase
VREVLVELQRRLGARADAVLDGRDIGSHVFPDAAYKFYLDADVRERAMRRFKELTAAGTQTSLEAVEADVKNRDRIDSSREFAPLCRAKDAQYVDTTSLNIEQVVEVLLRRITDSKDRNG